MSSKGKFAKRIPNVYNPSDIVIKYIGVGGHTIRLFKQVESDNSHGLCLNEGKNLYPISRRIKVVSNVITRDKSISVCLVTDDLSFTRIIDGSNYSSIDMEHLFLIREDTHNLTRTNFNKLLESI